MPWPSNAVRLRPRKSRTRGKASEISRSRNSYIRARRSVTLQPIAIPSRSRNPAIDLRAKVMIGFCPVICVSASTAVSRCFFSWIADADAHVDDDLLQPRQRQPVLAAQLLLQRRKDFFLVFFL